ncbi:lysine-2,3-aminomutase-like protein [Falsigemmobacter faecalis]|uniref:Lysine-2,3-aminomutase-like protein n=1 Tax=Falsigemmobacter faecalis TaxID=2488730 RepID=A0A3P3DI82_9RHOB|nr:lysine-2,3-aminomutase-like protein [Falsigemmobacter faecalis]RRH73959.1 lysine-2,3-aminomutase-like protein [Falsigemmobacter faecalis]
MSQALSSIAQLSRAGLTDPGQSEPLERVAAEFRVLISPAMHSAIAAPGDGVGRQFVPSLDELVVHEGDLADPIGDHAHEPVPGLTHRYPDRAILHLTQTCAVYCRFCFRRESVGDSGTLAMEAIERICDYLRATPAIREIILTGGDPLVLSPRRLGLVLEKLRGVGTLDLLRIHSRVPVVAPERITPELLDVLKGEVPVWIVVHTNHAQELTAEARAALARLADAGFPLLSQSVLLRGVNDTSEALEALFRTLLRLRVKPYYLHHCDLARGAGHFRTTLEEGMALMAALRGRISGTALPTYILDIPGGFGKVPINPQYFTKTPGGWSVTDPRGGKHHYSDPLR